MNSKLIPWFISVIGTYAGWWLGARVGFLTAFLLSVIGGGIGMYIGRKWVMEHL